VVDIAVVDIEEGEDIVVAVEATAVVAVEEDIGEDTQAITEETISGYAF